MNEKKLKQQARKVGSCELCGRVWQPEHFDSPRLCAFEGEVFSADNWNCGLVGEIREAMSDAAEEPHGLKVRCDDQSFGALMVVISEEDPFWGPGYSLMGMLAATWYKDRGSCDELKWAIGDRGVKSEELTRDEAVRIVAHLKRQEAAELEGEAAASEPAAARPPTGQPVVFTYETRSPETRFPARSPRPASTPNPAGNRAKRRAAQKRNH